MIQVNRIIVLLLVLQLISTGFLWTIDALNEISESIFALFVAVDLLSFAMISYIYRVEKANASPSKVWILTGCVLLLVMIFSSLIVH
jgi:hypothetical protein